VPVKYSAGLLLEGCEPILLISIMFFLALKVGQGCFLKTSLATVMADIALGHPL
jgi:hypothetical protein